MYGSEAQAEAMRLRAEGLTRSEIAARMGITAITYHKDGGRVSTASHLFRRAA